MARILLTLILGPGLLSPLAIGHRAWAESLDSPSTAAHHAANGCGLSAASGTVTLTPSIGGHKRTVLVHLPAGYSGHTKVALVLNLHGSGSTAAQQEAFSGMNATADTDHFIVAYPQARIPDGGGYDWNIPRVPLVGGKSVPKGAASDVSFLTHLVPYLEAHYCVDARRVDVTGMSGGGRMASQLGCDASTTFAAIAPVAGLRRPSPCPGKRAVPVVAFHGTADPVDPYNGHGQAYWTYSVPHAAQLWAKHDGCPSKPVTMKPAPGAMLTAYGPCRDSAVVELYSVTGEGHEWPGGPHVGLRITAVLGPQSNAVNADDVMWTFFATHPLR